VPTDIADPAAVERLARLAVKRFGRMDVWVEAVAVGVVGPLGSESVDEIRRLVDTNVFGTALCARAALATFQAQGSGVLVLVGSLLSLPLIRDPHRPRRAQEALRDRSWSVRVPRRLQQLRLDIARVREDLTHELHRSPTVTEIATRLEVDDETVIEALVAATAYRSESLSRPLGPDDDAATLADTLSDSNDAFATVDNRDALRGLMARLPVRERSILNLRFVDELSQVEIAERIGICQMHVSRLIKCILMQLHAGLSETD
jgi:RNA polymerase sigma factor (sigma-70 family)